MKNAQHSKCCFCESIFDATYAGDVEHFRPKAYSRQDEHSPRNYPGYYWLAYNWKNLFYVCSRCNNKKANYFPLANSATRARSPTDDVTLEQPLLLDPGGSEDPRDHIEFETSIAKSRTAEGVATIKLADLNRLNLETERIRILKHVETLKSVIVLAHNEPAGSPLALFGVRAQGVLAEMALASAPFSAMVQDNT